MPEISDSVAMDSDREITRAKDIQPLGDIGLREKNKEIEPFKGEIDERQYNSQANMHEKKEEIYSMGDERAIGEPVVNQEIKDIPDSYLDNVEIYERDTSIPKKQWFLDDDRNSSENGGSEDESGNGDKKDDG